LKIPYSTPIERAHIIDTQQEKGLFLTGDATVLVEKIIEEPIFGTNERGERILVSPEKKAMLPEYFLSFASEPLVNKDPEPTLEERVKTLEDKLK
jgi:hypothetical protein